MHGPTNVKRQTNLNKTEFPSNHNTCVLDSMYIQPLMLGWTTTIARRAFLPHKALYLHTTLRTHNKAL